MTTETKPLPKYFKALMIAIIGVPAVVAFIFTEKQWYPATYAIDWLSDDKGTFSVKAAVLLNTVMLLFGVLIIALFVLLLKRIFIRAGK